MALFLFQAYDRTYATVDGKRIILDCDAIVTLGLLLEIIGVD